MAYVPPVYETVQEPNTWGVGSHTKQVMVKPGYTDMSSEYEYQANMARIEALKAMLAQIPQAPSYDPDQAAARFMQQHVTPAVENKRAEMARLGDRGSFGGAEIGMMRAEGARQAADYGNSIANQNYGNAMDRWSRMASLTGMLGDLQSAGARNRGDSLSTYAQQQAYRNYKPYDSNGADQGIGKKILGGAVAAAGATLPTWGPGAKKLVSRGASWIGNQLGSWFV